MRSITFTIYDNKAAAYLEPWEASTPAVGLRRWMENCMIETTMFHKHPGDFSLHEKEYFDSELGHHVLLKTPIDHGYARTIIAQSLAAMEQEEREPAHFPTNTPSILKAIKDTK